MLKRYRGIILVIGLTSSLSLGVGAEQGFEEDRMNQADSIHIQVDGAPGTRFSANWRVTQDGDIQIHNEENATVPAEYHFSGEALEGNITLLGEGRLEVEVTKGGNRSRSSTQGKGSRLHLSVQ